MFRSQVMQNLIVFRLGKFVPKLNETQHNEVACSGGERYWNYQIRVRDAFGLSASCFCCFCLRLKLRVEKNLAWATETFVTLWEREIFLPLPEIQTQYIGCPSRTLVTIPNTISPIQDENDINEIRGRPGYNNIALCYTSSITSHILWYQLIPHS